MGKRLITQRRGRGSEDIGPESPQVHCAKHPKLKETVNGKITELEA